MPRPCSTQLPRRPVHTRGEARRWACALGFIAVLGACGTPAAPAEAPALSRSSAVSAPPAPPAPLPALVQACAGTHLDLAWLAEAPACQTPAGEPEIAASPVISERLEPALVVVEAGATATVDVVLHNGGAEATTFDIPALYCTTSSLELHILDAQGVRVDVPDGCPQGGGGCAWTPARVTLDAGGDARVRFELAATARCGDAPPRPLASGRYRVVIDRGTAFELPHGPAATAATLEVIAPAARR